MTNRDPFNTDFNRKLIDLYDTVTKYAAISSEAKLKSDKEKPDIDLVLAFHKKELLDHMRLSKLAYSDFVKVPYEDEQVLLEKMNKV
jgi:hypothetical protein